MSDEYVPTTDEVREDFAYPWEGFKQNREGRLAAFDRWHAAEVAAAKAEELDWCLQANRAYGMPRDLHAGLMARLAQLRGHGPLVYAEPESPKLLTEEDHDAEVAAAERRGAIRAMREAAGSVSQMYGGGNAVAVFLEERADREEAEQ